MLSKLTFLSFLGLASASYENLFGVVSERPAALLSEDFDYAEYNAFFADKNDDTVSMVMEQEDTTSVKPDYLTLFEDYQDDAVEQYALYREELDDYQSLMNEPDDVNPEALFMDDEFEDGVSMFMDNEDQDSSQALLQENDELESLMFDEEAETESLMFEEESLETEALLSEDDNQLEALLFDEESELESQALMFDEESGLESEALFEEDLETEALMFEDEVSDEIESLMFDEEAESESLMLEEEALENEALLSEDEIETEALMFEDEAELSTEALFSEDENLEYEALLMEEDFVPDNEALFLNDDDFSDDNELFNLLGDDTTDVIELEALLAENDFDDTSDTFMQLAAQGESVALGRYAIDLTNQYRGKQGLKPVVWDQAVHDQCVKHSQAMASGQVPFGHAGFGTRIKLLPFKSMSSKENVCWNMQSGRSAVAKAVDQWIKSAGHRKNMISPEVTHAAVGVYCKGRKCYFTQIFVKK